ncbi:A1S_2505 family phage non-structural protein [Alistipes putredinis]|uniref:A1S_2505 family phage non-structural protein n=1 Tax=Alistipes putredinis TaxID=28117 RepID=UPI0035226C7F
MSNKVFTPENISKLKQNEVFVFGSNKAGNHVGGAARVAVEKFGAIMGHGEGLQGQSYAIPTLDEQMDKVSTEELTRSVRRFADYTRYNTDKVFYVTKIGCGIAGFSVEEIVEVFKSVSFGDNVVLPQEFGEEKHIDGFKGFNADMTCLGFKFEEGKTYEEDVELKVCNRGFHFCESPFSVLSYRDMLDDECKFIPVHHVTALGRCHSDSDKTATTKIHIGAKLDFKGFIKAGIDFIYEKCIKEGPTDNVNSGDDTKIGSSGYGAQIGSSGYGAKIGSSGYGAKIGSSGYGAQIGSSGYGAKIGSSGYGAKIGSSGDGAKIGSSGYGAQIGSSGDLAKIGSSGDGAKIGSSGYGAQIGSSGDLAQIGSSGYGAKIGSSGYGAKIGSSGDLAKIGSSGDGAKIGSSGYGAQIGSSGYGAKIGSSGYGAKIGSSGYGAQIGSSGYGAQIGSSGDGAKIGSSGDGAQIGSSGYGAQIGSSGDDTKIGSSGDLAKIESEGNNAVVAAIGIDSKIKAKKGSWITLAEYGEDLKPVCVRSAQIDGKSLKEDVFYQLKGGEFVEAAE